MKPYFFCRNCEVESSMLALSNARSLFVTDYFFSIKTVTRETTVRSPPAFWSPFFFFPPSPSPLLFPLYWFVSLFLPVACLLLLFVLSFRRVNYMFGAALILFGIIPHREFLSLFHLDLSL